MVPAAFSRQPARSTIAVEAAVGIATAKAALDLPNLIRQFVRNEIERKGTAEIQIMLVWNEDVTLRGFQILWYFLFLDRAPSSESQ